MTLVPWRPQYNQLCQNVRYIIARAGLIFYTFLGLIWTLIFDSLLMAKRLGVTIGDNTWFPCLIFGYEDRNAVPIAQGLTWPPWRSADQTTSSPDWKDRIVQAAMISDSACVLGPKDYFCLHCVARKKMWSKPTDPYSNGSAINAIGSKFRHLSVNHYLLGLSSFPMLICHR